MVIEGPIQEVGDDYLLIFDFRIEFPPETPLLENIEVGDHLRIDGTMPEDGPTSDEDGNFTMIIVPVVVEPIGDELAIDTETGEVWRDNGTCNNPPPAWAPANGWRARCEGGNAPGNSGNAPGQNNNDDSPGNSGNAPGQNDNDDSPGNSGNAPGQNDNDDSPGNSGNAPGQNPNGNPGQNPDNNPGNGGGNPGNNPPGGGNPNG